MVSLIIIHWIEIYLMESSIQLLNNWGQQVMWQSKVKFSGHMISVSYFFYLLENEKIVVL